MYSEKGTTEHKHANIQQISLSAFAWFLKSTARACHGTLGRDKGTIPSWGYCSLLNVVLI